MPVCTREVGSRRPNSFSSSDFKWSLARCCGGAYVLILLCVHISERAEDRILVTFSIFHNFEAMEKTQAETYAFSLKKATLVLLL